MAYEGRTEKLELPGVVVPKEFITCMVDELETNSSGLIEVNSHNLKIDVNNRLYIRRYATVYPDWLAFFRQKAIVWNSPYGIVVTLKDVDKFNFVWQSFEQQLFMPVSRLIIQRGPSIVLDVALEGIDVFER